MRIIRPMLNAPPNIEMKGAQVYSCEMSSDPAGNITRMVNRVEKLPSYLAADEANLTTTKQQLEQAKALQFQPFPQEQELSEKIARLTELTHELDLSKQEQQAAQAEEAERTDSAEKSEEPAAECPRRLSDRLREAREAIAARQPMPQGNPVRMAAVEH